MPKIRINSVQCTTPDEIDKDEMYLKKDGKKIWPPGELYHRVDTGDVEQVGLELEVEEGWNEIELWDFDFVSLNDRLGVFKFKVDDLPVAAEVIENAFIGAFIILVTLHATAEAGLDDRVIERQL